MILDEPQTSTSFIIISVILSTLVVATIVGNTFVILAILLDKNLQTTANQLVLSLAVADLMVACLVMPLGAYNDIYNGWYLSKEVCEFWTSADVLCCTASILNLLAIALDRYWAVTNVDYIYRRTRKRVNVMIFCAWTVGAVVSLAPTFGWKDPDFAKRVIEEHKCMVSQDVSYQIFATISTFYAPLVLLLALYWRIFQVARKRIRRKPGQLKSGPIEPDPLACERPQAPACDRSRPSAALELASPGADIGSLGPSQQSSSVAVSSSTNAHGHSQAAPAAAAVAATGPAGEARSPSMWPQNSYSSARVVGTENAQSNYTGRAECETAAANFQAVARQTAAATQTMASDKTQQPADGVEDAAAAAASRRRLTPDRESRTGGPQSRSAAQINERRRNSGRHHAVDLTTSAGVGETSQAAPARPARPHDNKNNGPERRAPAGDSQRHQDRKVGWRRNKVAPIELLCSSEPPDGPDPGAAAAADPTGHNNGAGNNDKWERQGLEAGTQAFGSLSSSTASSLALASPSSSSSSSLSAPSSLWCLERPTDAADGFVALAASSSSGVKMNEGVSAGASNEGSLCCSGCNCCECERRCQCKSLATMQREACSEKGEKEEEEEHQQSLEQPRGGVREREIDLDWRPASERPAATADSDGQINHELAAENSSGAYLVGGLQPIAGCSTCGPSNVPCLAATKSPAACLKSPASQKPAQANGPLTEDKRLAGAGRRECRGCQLTVPAPVAAAAAAAAKDEEKPVGGKPDVRSKGADINQRQVPGDAGHLSAEPLQLVATQAEWAPAGPRNRTIDDGASASESGSDGSPSAASSSLLACLHHGVSQPDDDDYDDEESDESSLSTSFPAPRNFAQLAAVGSTHSLAEQEKEEVAAVAAGKSHKRGSRCINNLTTCDIGARTEVDGSPTTANTPTAEVDALAFGNKQSRPGPSPSRGANNLSAGHGEDSTQLSWPDRILTGASTANSSVSAAAVTEHRQQQQAKPRRKLERRDPIQVNSMRWPVRHQQPQPPQRSSMRSSLDIRRRFRAMGQLVSFVQTSRNLNGSFSSASTSSVRSVAGIDLVAERRQLSAVAADTDRRREAQQGETDEGLAKQRRQQPNSVTQDEQQQQQLAIISSGRHQMMDGHQALDAENQRKQHPLPLASNSTAPETDNQRRHKQMELARAAAATSKRTRANMDIKREKKAAKTLAIITGVFVCCWLPFFVNAILMPVCGAACTPSDLVLSILLWLGYLNSLLNPIIYTIFSPDFRRAFRRLLCWPQLINMCPRISVHSNGKLVAEASW